MLLELGMPMESVFARYNSIGRGLIMRKYEGKNTHNLKRGGRKTLQAGYKRIYTKEAPARRKYGELYLITHYLWRGYCLMLFTARTLWKSLFLPSPCKPPLKDSIHTSLSLLSAELQ